jgi:hypothetical protein
MPHVVGAKDLLPLVDKRKGERIGLAFLSLTRYEGMIRAQ